MIVLLASSYGLETTYLHLLFLSYRRCQTTAPKSVQYSLRQLDFFYSFHDIKPDVTIHRMLNSWYIEVIEHRKFLIKEYYNL